MPHWAVILIFLAMNLSVYLFWRRQNPGKGFLDFVYVKNFQFDSGLFWNVVSHLIALAVLLSVLKRILAS